MGDLIDQGPEQLRTCALVRAMAEDGETICLMGNHEYNAIRHQLDLRDLRGVNDPHTPS